MFYVGAMSDGAGTWTWDDTSPWAYTSSLTDIAGTTETRMAVESDLHGDGEHGKWHDVGIGEDLLGVLCQRVLPYSAKNLMIILYVYQTPCTQMTMARKLVKKIVKQNFQNGYHPRAILKKVEGKLIKHTVRIHH